MTEVAAQRTHVVVVGGGYAGTLAANHLRQRPDIDITLVNPRPVFVERIRLHQLVADTGAATADYATLLGDGIRLVVDTVDRIEATARRVLLSSGAELDYDYLIYAVGSTGATPVDGARVRRLRVLDRRPGKRAAVALRARRPAAGRARHRRRRRADRHRNGFRAGRTGPPGDPGVRRRARPVAEQAGPAFGCQAAARFRCQRAGIRGGDRGALGRGGAQRRRRAAQRGDRLDGGLRRAGPGRAQRAEHRRAGPAAHRRDADQRRQSLRRRGG